MLAILGPCGIFSSESVLASGNRPQPVSVADDPVASAVWEVREVKGKDETRYDITIYQVPAPGGDLPIRHVYGRAGVAAALRQRPPPAPAVASPLHSRSCTRAVRGACWLLLAHAQGG